MSLSSVPSAKSFLSPKSNGHVGPEQNQHTSSLSSAIYTGSYLKSLPSSKLPNDSLTLNPDELFTKHTVSEIRAVQQRLRADADAKQEELRLMVGERYRDLLQASSSIISIAKSSQRVLGAIEESKEAILSQHDLPSPPQIDTVDGVDDRHLHTLQVLSAHMKLLLDAPEHLWRLIERKKYLQAAWLFLFARVVHRALVRHDEHDDHSWVNEGVDVSTDFPLVQRQWDVVSQFRSQIIHKSTLSLREASASAEETCATLVTLHLLDSRPLSETLAALLSQRSKTLQSILSWNPDSQSSNKENKSATTNGHATGLTRSVPVRKVTQTMKKALNTIAQTVCTAKAIFKHENSEPSLLVCVLEKIQAESSELETRSKCLPEELLLSTQSLLTQLTSSANFQLLPADLRSYKPYVDLNSSSASLTQSNFSQTLQEWFKKSTDKWQTAASKWFSGVQTVKEVWILRSSVRRSVMGYALDQAEKNHLLCSVDFLCHERTLDIWKTMLLDAEVDFKTLLRDSGSSSKAESTTDLHPADFLFSPPPIPVLSQTVKSFVDALFQKYQLALKRQLVGRSSQLDNVLSTLEQCARTIQHDVSHVRVNADEKTKPFIEQLTKSYQPAANTLSSKVVAIIDEATTDAIHDTVSNTDNLVFLSRVTEDLSSCSPFIENIGCTQQAAQDFKTKAASLNDKAITKWREIIITRVVNEHRSQLPKHPSQTTGPSPTLLQSLLSVSDHIQRLGVVYHPVRQHAIVQDTLRNLITCWINESPEMTGEQIMLDLAFLRKVSGLYGPAWMEVSELLDARLRTLALDSTKLADLEASASEYLARTQTMFATLLPPPLTLVFDTPLLQFGAPSVGQTYHSAIDLAKPSPRFGMLLVGNVER